MSGHSKWANIKHKKGRTDAVRGKITTKISREITIAVKMGGPDPIGNMKLKLALSKAKANNVPKDNIKRAISKGSGIQDGTKYEEMTYEGYGAGGVAVMVSALTDNRNRTAADVRHLFSKYGGNLGETGSVNWMFKKKGVVVVENEEEQYNEEDVLMIVLEAGAEDLKVEEGSFEIITEPTEFETVEKALIDNGIEVAMSEITYIPDNIMEVTSEVTAKIQSLVETLEELDDVEEVYTSADLPDEE